MSESQYQMLRIVVYVVGVPIIVALVIRIVRRVREIRELDARLKAEEAARKAQGIVEDPYAAMARMFSEAETPEAKKPESGRDDRRGKGR